MEFSFQYLKKKSIKRSKEWADLMKSFENLEEKPLNVDYLPEEIMEDEENDNYNNDNDDEYDSMVATSEDEAADIDDESLNGQSLMEQLKNSFHSNNATSICNSYDDTNSTIQDLLNQTKPIIDSLNKLKESGIENILNTFDTEKIDECTQKWLQINQTPKPNRVNEYNHYYVTPCNTQIRPNVHTLHSCNVKSSHDRTNRVNCVSCRKNCTFPRLYECQDKDEYVLQEIERRKSHKYNCPSRYPDLGFSKSLLESPCCTKKHLSKKSYVRRLLISMLSSSDSETDIDSPKKLSSRYDETFKGKASMMCGYERHHDHYRNKACHSSIKAYPKENTYTHRNCSLPNQNSRQMSCACCSHVTSIKQSHSHSPDILKITKTMGKLKLADHLKDMRDHKVAEHTNKPFLEALTKQKKSNTLSNEVLDGPIKYNDSQLIKKSEHLQSKKKKHQKGSESVNDRSEPIYKTDEIDVVNVVNAKANDLKKQKQKNISLEILDISSDSSLTDATVLENTIIKRPQKNKKIELKTKKSKTKTKKITKKVEKENSVIENTLFQRDIEKAIKISLETYEMNHKSLKKVKPIEMPTRKQDKREHYEKARNKNCDKIDEKISKTLKPQPKSMIANKMEKIKREFLHDISTTKNDTFYSYQLSDDVRNSTALVNDTAKKREISKHQHMQIMKKVNFELDEDDAGADCTIVTSTTTDTDYQLKSSTTDNDNIKKDILIYTPNNMESLPETSFQNGRFILTEDHLISVIGEKSAKKFIKFYRGKRQFDMNSTIYFKPPKDTLLDDESDSDVDELELFGNCGQIYEAKEE